MGAEYEPSVDRDYLGSLGCHLKHRNIALRAVRVGELRRLELEKVVAPVNGGEADLRPLWFTAYGFEILTALNAGLRVSETELEPVRSALRRVGVEMKTTEDRREKPLTESDTAMSDELKHHLVKSVYWKHIPDKQGR